MSNDIPSLPYRSLRLENSEEWLEELKTRGYTVVNQVAKEEEVEKARSLLWKWLSRQGTGIRREKSSTWTDEAWPDWPGYKKYGSLKNDGAVHQEAAWFLRGLPSLKRIFELIYKTDDLIVSMDGLIVWRSWQEDEGRRPSSSGLHVDQNPFKKPGFHCVQGMLPLYPVTPEVGGTMVVPGSHLDQDKLRSRYPGWSKHGRDYCVLINKDPLQGSEVLIPLQPGDILLWDSRLAHCGRVGSGDTSSELSRASLCVCMGPRSHASSEVLSRRRCALKEGWSFNHCPWEATVKKRQDLSKNYYHPKLSEDQWELV